MIVTPVQVFNICCFLKILGTQTVSVKTERQGELKNSLHQGGFAFIFLCQAMFCSNTDENFSFVETRYIKVSLRRALILYDYNIHSFL